jgi:hypothetical protein
MGPQAFRDGIFSASDPLSPYGTLLTSYSDGTLGAGPLGTLGDSKLARPVQKSETEESTEEYDDYYAEEGPNYKLWAIVGAGVVGVGALGYFLLKK